MGQAIMRINPQSREKFSILWEASGYEANDRSGLGKASSRSRSVPRRKTVDWHSYCIDEVIGGIKPERSSGFQVSLFRFREIGKGTGWNMPEPRLPHLVESVEEVKEMKTDGSHCKKGI